MTPGRSTGGTERQREGGQRLAGKEGVVMTGETKEKKGIVRGKERGREVEERHLGRFSDTLSQKPPKQSKEVRPSGKPLGHEGMGIILEGS